MVTTNQKSTKDIQEIKRKESKYNTIESHQHTREYIKSPGQVAQLVGTSCQYTKAAGLILSQSTYKNQPVNA